MSRELTAVSQQLGGAHRGGRGGWGGLPGVGRFAAFPAPARGNGWNSARPCGRTNEKTWKKKEPCSEFSLTLPRNFMGYAVLPDLREYTVPLYHSEIQYG